MPMRVMNSSGADPGIFERGGPEAIIYKILERGGPKPLKWLLNAHFSHFLINLLQIFHKKGAWAPPLNPQLLLQYRRQTVPSEQFPSFMPAKHEQQGLYATNTPTSTICVHTYRFRIVFARRRWILNFPFSLFLLV